MPSKSQTHSLTKYLAKAINSPSSAVPVTMKVSSFFERNQGEAEIPRDQSSPAGKQTPEKKKEEWKKALSEDAEDDASSAVSDISASTEGDVRDQGESLDERSETFQRFEKTLRAKHTKACKAMSVSFYACAKQHDEMRGNIIDLLHLPFS